MNKSSLFKELNDKTALDFLMKPPEETLVTVEASPDHIRDEFGMALQFTMAANLLQEAALKKGVPWFYSSPILFLYRHAIELYLKAVLISPPKQLHDLRKLLGLLVEQIRTQYGHDISRGWFAETILEFATVDPKSTRFRYALEGGKRQAFSDHHVNLEELKARLNDLFLMFHHLKMAQMPRSKDDSTQTNVGIVPTASQEPKPQAAP